MHPFHSGIARQQIVNWISPIGTFNLLKKKKKINKTLGQNSVQSVGNLVPECLCLHTRLHFDMLFSFCSVVEHMVTTGSCTRFAWCCHPWQLPPWEYLHTLTPPMWTCIIATKFRFIQLELGNGCEWEGLCTLSVMSVLALKITLINAI